jgi:pyruvate dehydrogenase E1 component beta subunit
MTELRTARERNISQTISDAIAIEMERDERIVVLGEDVGRLGGVFGTTRGLQQRYGDKRVRDTPISELGFTGMGVGLALAGYRPLVELMFVDFIGVNLEQVYNAMAKNHYMSGGTVRMPMVLKTAGGCIGSAAQHSQTLWGLFAHLPGMRVVVPSCPYNAKGLMAAALESDDPVVYIEHKGLLLLRGADFAHGREVPDERYTVPIGRAAVVREGADVTIATLGASVRDSLLAAGTLAGEGVDVEVIDLQSVVPLDADAVAESAARTRRLLVVDEDYMSFGLSAELVVRVLDRVGLGGLDRYARHALPDVPIPAAVTLERAVVPNAESIAAAVRGLA